jgi:DNA polymerase delta subunit 1
MPADTKLQTKAINAYSKKYGRQPTKDITLHGRISLDLFRFIRSEYYLPSYSLNAVCAHLLGKGEQKEDVSISVITELQNGTPETRRQIAVYCLKVVSAKASPMTFKCSLCIQDAYLPQRILDKSNGLVRCIERSRVTTLPFNMLLNHGQSIKVLLQLFRRANENGYLVPRLLGAGMVLLLRPSRLSVWCFIAGQDDEYFDKVDLDSPCPDIMAEYNLCYSTLLKRETVDTLGLVKDVDYFETPHNGTSASVMLMSSVLTLGSVLFVKSTRRRGILPILIEDLASALAQVDSAIEEETDVCKETMLQGRRDALKVRVDPSFLLWRAHLWPLDEHCLCVWYYWGVEW